MRVLIVEDSPEIAHLVSLILSAEGVETVEWTDRFDAIVSETNWDEVDVVIADKFLGIYDGTQLLYWLKREHPEIRRIMMTGDSAVDIASSPAHIVLIKPATVEVIRNAVHGGGAE